MNSKDTVSCSAFQIRTCGECERYKKSECELTDIEKPTDRECDYQPGEEDVMNL